MTFRFVWNVFEVLLFAGYIKLFRHVPFHSNCVILQKEALKILKRVERIIFCWINKKEKYISS